MTKYGPRRVFSAERSGQKSIDPRSHDSLQNEDYLLAFNQFVKGNDDNTMLQMLQSMKAEIDEIKTYLIPEDEKSEKNNNQDSAEFAVRVQIAQMVREIGQAKSELATIKHPYDNSDRIRNASNELEAIVKAAEKATHSILEANENIERQMGQIANLAHDDQDLLNLVDSVSNETIKIIESCNFQDISGQRITKVITTMQFIEKHILAMIEIWGAESFSDLPVSRTDNQSNDEDVPLEGPQMKNQGISQDDIDKLFD